MLGDSITEWAGDWSSLLGTSKKIVNEGISGNTGHDILNRLDYVYVHNPDYVFIMFGINDIFQGYEVDTVFSNYQKIINGIPKNTKAEIIIQSTLYVYGGGLEFSHINQNVDLLNQKLLDYTKKNNLTFLNLNDVLSKDGMLRADCNVDGVHLSQFAYSLWAKLLQEKFREIL